MAGIDSSTFRFYSSAYCLELLRIKSGTLNVWQIELLRIAWQDLYWPDQSSNQQYQSAAALIVPLFLSLMAWYCNYICTNILIVV